MTLRHRIEQIVTELDGDLFLAGAPLSTAADLLRAALAKDAPRVFTTVEELNSEEAAEALVLITPDNTGVVAHWDRSNGKNIWARPGVGGTYTSEELLEDTDDSYAGGFSAIPGPAAAVEVAPKPVALPALVTPCHGRPLWVSTRSESYFGGYGSTEVVDDISCDEPGCLNTWDRDGTVLYQTPTTD